MAQYAANEIENMPDGPVAREDLGAGIPRGAGARSPLFWKVLLLSVAIIWGYSFTTMKDALGTIPVFELLYVRFLPAALVMFVIFHKRIIAHLNARNLIVGLGMGALMWAAYALQTVGLAQTTAGKNAFLTGTYCILVPFASYFLSGEKLTRYNLGAALLCLAGIGLVALDSVEFNIGDAITLGGAVFFAIQMSVTAKYGRKMDINVITFWMFVGNGVLSLISSLLFETQAPASVWTPSFIGVMAFLSAGLQRGAAHPKRWIGARPSLDGLAAPFDGVAFGCAVLGAADGGGAHLAPARRLRAHLSFDYLERDAFRFFASKAASAILNNLLRRLPGRHFLCVALKVVPCTLRYTKCLLRKTLLEGIYGTSTVRSSTAISAPRPPRRRRPLSATVLLQKFRLLQTSSLRGDTIYIRCPSWVIASRRPLRISKRA